MKKKKTKLKGKIIFFLVIMLMAGIVVVTVRNGQKSDEAVRSEILAGEYDLSDQDETVISYNAYLAELENSGKLLIGSGDEIYMTAEQYSESTMTDLVVFSDGSVRTGADGSISYAFDVETSGTYKIEVGYLPTADSNAVILRSLYINGVLPFVEAETITFNRMWKDENKDFLMKADTNQGFSTQIQDPKWTSMQLYASDMSTAGPLLFYLEQGNNSLTFQSKQATLDISYIKLVPAEDLIDYDEYISLYQQAGVAAVDSAELTDGVIMVQAEDSLYKTSSTLLTVNDRTSPLTIPYHASNIVQNTIGGNSWNMAGQGISWQVTVPKSGLYRIATRFMQAENRDFYSIRELKVNGEVPFSEAADIKFYYDSKFQTEYLGSETGAYYIYLEEGINTIALTVALGDLSYAIDQTTLSVKNFNNLYRRLVAVTGSSPDQYRDYQILSSVPDMVEILKTEYYRLNLIMESLGDTLEDSKKTRVITKMLYQLEILIEKPDEISTELAEFNNNITAIGEWMLSISKQALQLDYILVCGENYELPKAEGNLAQIMMHNTKAFIGSFTNDYVIESAEVTKKDTDIEVWIATATRDQYDIAQRMIDHAFRDKSFRVSLKMVSADTVMPATLTGNGPDVALQLNYTMPSNFAYRDAAYDLTTFADFDEVADEFAEGAMEYFEYNGGYYALPDQMSFPVMYYRSDILNDLGLEVPNTWEELLSIIPYLQSENMGMYFVTTGHTILGGYSSTATKPVNSVFLSLLYQNGESLYNSTGAKSNLDTMTSLMTFKYWTEFYTKQSFGLTMNVVTRFRTGQTPIIIEDYTYTNAINAAAPEIEGDWSIAPIPGTLQEDGTIDRSTSCMVGASMIIKNIVEEKGTKEEAWEFLKWWTSNEAQITYATEQKALFGDSADFPVANLEAVKTLSAERGISNTIEETLKWLRGTPQVPGGYITGRSVENAFLSVANDNLNPVDTLFSEIRYINAELTIKRKEFGLED